MLKAVITADIVNSRKEDPRAWLKTLKTELERVGKTPQDWEIYRGDSLQLLTTPQHALRTAIQLKAAIKQYKTLDMRLGIGIGEVSYCADKITESNGSAFVRSGTQFDALMKDETMGIESPWEDFDETINLMMSLLSKLMSAWNPNRALVVHSYLINPELTQRELGGMLNKQQGNLSYSLNKAGYDELKRVLAYYESNLLKKLNS